MISGFDLKLAAFIEVDPNDADAVVKARQAMDAATTELHRLGFIGVARKVKFVNRRAPKPDLPVRNDPPRMVPRHGDEAAE